MTDELVSALLKDSNLKVVLATTTQLSRRARQLHLAQGAAAEVLAHGLTGALLIASLQKELTRVNLQLTCDGSVGGFLADAGSDGTVRGYVKNPLAAMHGSEVGGFKWRPLYGNSGLLSVLREMGNGEYYRSSVELEAFDLSLDLERYFATSEQLTTHVVLDSIAEGDEPLGTVAGIFVQPLPNGDREEAARLGKALQGGGFRSALAQAHRLSAAQLLTSLFPDRTDLDLMARYPASFTCTCSEERVKRSLLAMGRAELEDLLIKDGKAEATCHFCSTQYVISGEQIRELITSAEA